MDPQFSMENSCHDLCPSLLSSDVDSCKNTPNLRFMNYILNIWLKSRAFNVETIQSNDNLKYVLRRLYVQAIFTFHFIDSHSIFAPRYLN